MKKRGKNNIVGDFLETSFVMSEAQALFELWF